MTELTQIVFSWLKKPFSFIGVVVAPCLTYSLMSMSKVYVSMMAYDDEGFEDEDFFEEDEEEDYGYGGYDEDDYQDPNLDYQDE